MISARCAIFSAALFALPTPITAQESLDAQRVTSTIRFAGAAQVRREEAKTLKSADPLALEPVNVEIRNWTIGGGLKLEKLDVPSNGTLVVQLRAGEMTTIIEGERVERREGDFWTVEAGQVMAVETEDDTAILQTTFVAD